MAIYGIGAVIVLVADGVPIIFHSVSAGSHLIVVLLEAIIEVVFITLRWSTVPSASWLATLTRSNTNLAYGDDVKIVSASYLRYPIGLPLRDPATDPSVVGTNPLTVPLDFVCIAPLTSAAVPMDTGEK